MGKKHNGSLINFRPEYVVSTCSAVHQKLQLGNTGQNNKPLCVRLQNFLNCELNFLHSFIIMKNCKITLLLITYFVILNSLSSVNVFAFQESESESESESAPVQNIANSTSSSRNRTQSPTKTENENNGTYYNAPCSILGEKCAFENSVCLVKIGLDYQCQCDGISYYEGPQRMCRKSVGESCEDSEDCINYAVCRIPIFSLQISTVNSVGKCNCTEGFTYDEVDPFTCYSTTGNDATSLGDNCTNLFEPCAFSNSKCTVGGSDSGTDTDTWSKTCQCDDGSIDIDEGGSGACKKIIGTICETGSEECIAHAECAPVQDVPGLNFGFCHCIEGYSDEESGLSKCTLGGSGAGSSEVLIVTRVHFFLVVVFPFLSRLLLCF